MLALITFLLLVLGIQGCRTLSMQETVPLQTDSPSLIPVLPTITTEVDRANTPSIASPEPYTATLVPRNRRIGWIAFSSERDGESDIYLVSSETGEVVRLGLSTIGYVIAPAWSPDWQWIAFASANATPTAAYDLYIVPAACIDLPEGCLPHVVNLTSDDDQGLYLQPAWSPDGKRIAYSYLPRPNTKSHIWLMNSDGTGRQQLSTIEGSQPAWSPNGEFIAFKSNVIGEQWGVFEGETNCIPCGNVFVMSADGSNLHRLTQLLPDSGQPAWSPDGTMIALHSARGQDVREHSTHIFLVNLSGTEIQQISEENSPGGGPQWSPDGSQLVFESVIGEVGLYLINTDGTNLRPLTDDWTDSSPAWAP